MSLNAESARKRCLKSVINEMRAHKELMNLYILNKKGRMKMESISPWFLLIIFIALSLEIEFKMVRIGMFSANKGEKKEMEGADFKNILRSYNNKNKALLLM